MGLNKVLDPAISGRSVPGLVAEIYVSFFMTYLSSCNNIFDTETYFWSNIKILLGHPCTS